MISLEFSPSHDSTSKVWSEPTRHQHPSNNFQHVFSDSFYLRQVIRLLRNERKRKGLGIQELTARARLREGVITKAEKNGVIRTCREFRVWAKSLGLQWEQLWTLAFPLAEKN